MINYVDNIENSQNNSNTSKYTSKITWALDSHYACAVEIDEYDGDVLESGTYRFYPDAVVLGTEKIPTIWDIYVSDNYYNHLNELKEDEYKGSVGGLDKLGFTFELNKGQYVYVKYNKVANNNPTGILIIEKMN